MTDEQQPQPQGQLEFRATKQLGVSFPRRIIELVVMPYESEAVVPHPTEKRMVREVVSRGAFDGIERRANRIRVNRDHVPERTVGRAVAIHPSRDEGLVAELRIAQTELGDETLALADEECLDASAGFLPFPGGEVWETRSLRRLTKVWLGHIAMTPDPAYDAARVLAVRNAEKIDDQSSTPNLDLVRSWILEDRFAILDTER